MASFILGTIGCLALALRIDRHWRHVMRIFPTQGVYRSAAGHAGGFFLCGSLALCLEDRPASLGIVLWFVETMAAVGLAAVILALVGSSRGDGKP